MLNLLKFALWPLKLSFDDGGGGGGGGGGTTNSTTTVQQYSPEEAAARSKVINTALDVYGSTRGKFQNPAIAALAGPSWATQTAEQGLMDLAGDVRQNVVPGMQGGLQYLTTQARDVQNNPFFRGAVDASLRPVIQQFTEAGGPLAAIRAGAGNAEQYGGSRQGIAEGIALRGLGQTLADTAGKMGSAAYGQGLDATARGLQASPMVMSASAMPTSWEASVGAANDARNQQGLNRDAQIQAWGQNAEWIPLQNLANVVFGAGSSQATTNAQTPTPVSPRSSPLQSLGTLAGIGSGIASMSTAGF